MDTVDWPGTQATEPIKVDGRPRLLHPGTGGGTDAGFANQSGKAAVLESLGLPGWGCHANNE